MERIHGGQKPGLYPERNEGLRDLLRYKSGLPHTGEENGASGIEESLSEQKGLRKIEV